MNPSRSSESGRTPTNQGLTPNQRIRTENALAFSYAQDGSRAFLSSFADNVREISRLARSGQCAPS